MAANDTFSATASTGATIAIAAANRAEVLLRSAGPDRVHIAFNTPAIFGKGLFLDSGDAVTLNGPKADCDIYMICDTGETAEVGYSLAP